MKNQPLFSIIVPVYNVEKYIVECLESIVNQTFDDYEVLLIDDGSTDSSGKICDCYAEKCENVTVYHNDNKGQSFARNFGIDKSVGQYILFIDSDDWVNRDLLKTVAAVTDGNYEVVLWNSVNEFNNKTIEKRLFNKDCDFLNKEVYTLRRKIIGPITNEMKDPRQLDIFAPIWNKLYSARIIKDNNIYFDDINQTGTFEDGLFNFRYFGNVKNAYYINACLYHYRKTNSKSSTALCRTDLFEKWDNLFKILSDIIDREDLSQEYKQALNNRIAISVYMLGSIAVKSGLCGKEQKDLMNDVFNKPMYSASIEQLELKDFQAVWKIYYYYVKKNNASIVLVLNRIIQFAARYFK